MAPIRVGIIGLTASDAESYVGGNWGVEHLRALQGSPLYKITAVCNSSLESSQKAIAIHKLQGVTPHGNPEDIAKDPNVDLVAVVVNVNRHLQLARPALLNKKNVYVEYPVGVTLDEVLELQKLAEQNGVKVVVGAQATGDPMYRKMAELVKSKAIGDIVLSSLTYSIPITAQNGWPEAMIRFLDVNAGDNRVKVLFGHSLAAHNKIIGPLSSMQSILKVAHKTVPLLSGTNEVTDPAFAVKTPDTVLVQGLSPSGAASSISWRGASTPIGGTGIRWLISGTAGELELTTAKPNVAQYGGLDGKLRLRKWGEDEQEIDVSDGEDVPEYVRGLAAPSKNIAMVYDDFAKGKRQEYTTMEEGVVIQQMLEALFKEGVWAA